MTIAARAMAERKTLGAAVIAGRHAHPILEPAKHDLNGVPPLVSALVVFHRCLALLPTRDTAAYHPVLQSFSEPVGVVAAIPKESIDIWEADKQRSCTKALLHSSFGGGFTL